MHDISPYVDHHYFHFSPNHTFLQDIFHLETPGGGGYGDPKMKFVAEPPANKKQRVYAAKGSLATYKLTQESA